MKIQTNRWEFDKVQALLSVWAKDELHWTFYNAECQNIITNNAKKCLNTKQDHKKDHNNESDSTGWMPFCFMSSQCSSGAAWFLK